MGEHDGLAERFETHRSHLLAVAYRMLGLVSERAWQGWRMVTIPDHSDVDYVTLFVRERQALLNLLANLDDAGWGRPTPCPGWSVLDLSCHLIGDDLSLLARQRDSHFGTRPPEGLREEAAFVEWLDALQDRWVQASRRLSSRLVRDRTARTGSPRSPSPAVTRS
jgi:hypothetical protein